jgi:hypothetical protein
MGLIITCKENSRLVTQSWDRPLSLRERLAMRLHLFVCDNCVRFSRQMRQLREWLRREEGGGELSREARSRIAEKLREQTPESGDR